MNVYTVYKQGQYRHEILGVFDSLENARKRAFVAILAEKDGYHRFAVAVSQINEHVDDLKVLYYLGSENHTYNRERPCKTYPRTPESRDIVLMNTQYEIIEILISMNYDLEM